MIDKKELDGLIWDVTDLGYRVTRINNLLAGMSEGQSKSKYVHQYLELMEEYNKCVGYLTVELEDYIKYEKQNNLVIDFEYRKLLKSLKSY